MPDIAVTLCLTAGGRPDLLRRTLSSLLPHNTFDAAFISNDGADPETSAVVRELLPSATLVEHAPRLGQMRVIDDLYARVQTPFIFHCEDDWLFDPISFLPTLVEAYRPETMTSLVVRQSGCLYNWMNGGWAASSWVEADAAAIEANQQAGWGGYSFNPGLVATDLWRQLGPFAKYGSEVELSRASLAMGKKAETFYPGVCYHIGGGRHVEQQAQTPSGDACTWLQRMLALIT